MTVHLVIFGLLDLFRRKKKPVEEETVVEPREPPKPPEPPEWLDVRHKIDFEGDSIRIRVRITNRSDELIGKPTVRLLVSSALFDYDTDEVSVLELEGGKSFEATFHLKPKEELRTYEPKVEVEYFDFTLKQRVTFPVELEPIVFEDEFEPHPYEMDEDEFRVFTGQKDALEVMTEEMPVGGKRCHDAVLEHLRTLNVHIVEPVMVAPEIFRSIIRMGCRDQEGAIYGAEVQIVGNENLSKMLIRVWTENGRHMIGLRNFLVDEINRVVPIKSYIVR